MSTTASQWINAMTWEEIAEHLRGGNCTALVPVGSTEQHGPACPTGLDTYVAIMLAEDTARRTGTLIAPGVWYGNSEHHMCFPGTLTVQPLTLIRLVVDICSSLIRHGFRNVIVINGHRGANLPALTLAVQEVRQRYPDSFLAVADPFKLSTSITPELLEAEYEFHATELETSQLMYRHPELVKRDRLTKETPDYAARFSRFFAAGPLHSDDSMEIPFTAEEEKAMSASGVLGDATAANPKKGRLYHERMVDNLVEMVNWLKERGK